MKEKMSKHIDMLFETAPKTRKALELKEELLTNSFERYDDLVADGISPEDAYENVIYSMGNVSELFFGLDDMNASQVIAEVNRDTERTNSIKSSMFAVLWSTIIMLYFLISFVTYDWYITWIIFLVGLCLHTIIELIFRLKEMK